MTNKLRNLTNTADVAESFDPFFFRVRMLPPVAPGWFALLNTHAMDCLRWPAVPGHHSDVRDTALPVRDPAAARDPSTETQRILSTATYESPPSDISFWFGGSWREAAEMSSTLARSRLREKRFAVAGTATNSPRSLAT